MSGGLVDSGVPQSTDEHNEAESSEPCRRLTFVSHAGEDKLFARFLLDAIEAANVATFFDDDMAVGTPAGNEMTTRAATADQGVVVLSRPFLTKKWPMMELNLFVKNGIRIHPLYFDVSPKELDRILETYDSRAGDDEPDFRCKMNENPGEWQKLMEEVADSTRFEDSASLPNPMCWREDLRELRKLTGLRRKDFKDDEKNTNYATAVAKMVSPPVLPAIVPALPDHFVNVHMVDCVISKLLDCTPNTVVGGVVLTGIGGAGKSVIASAVVRDKRIRRHFTDGVLWLDQQPGEYNEKLFLLKLKELAQQFKEVVLSRRYRQGRDVQYHVDDFTSVSDAQGSFQKWQKKYDLRCLLVVDNTWNVQILEAVSLMGFQVLATTRKEAAIPASPGWRSNAVPRMDEDISLRVLQNCSGAPSAVPRQPALEVAKTCSFLPLALAIIGSTLRGVENVLSPDAWRKLQGKLKDKEMIHDEGEWGSLNNILAVSIDELGRARRDLFLMLAVLGKGILAPAEMLRNLWDEEDLEGARFFVEGLVTRSLLQRRDTDHYFVHDRLLDFAKVNINAKVKKFEAIKRQTQYLGRLDVLQGYSVGRNSLEGVYSLIGMWRSLEQLSGDEHLEVEAYKASLGKLGGEDESTDVANICSDLAELYKLQSKYDEADPLYLRMIEIYEKTLGPDHLHLAASLNNRAGLLKSQGKYAETEPLYEQSHAILENVLGSDDPDVASSLSNQAGLLERQGKYEQAEPLYKRAQEIYEKSRHLDHPNVATVLNNRARLLKSQGKYDEAEPLYKRTQEMFEKSLGRDHPNVASILNNRAELLKSQGKYEQAEPLYERAIVIWEAALGSEHPQVATGLNNWAALLYEQGKYEQAEPLYKRAIVIWEAALGSEHPKVAAGLNNRAELLRAQGKYAEAELLCERCQAIEEKALGPEHPSLARTLINRAGLLESLGKYEEVGPLYERSLAIREKALGPDHPDVAHSLNNWAELLQSQGKYEDAGPLYERAAAINVAVHGLEHPRVAADLNNRAGFLGAQGKYAEAEPLYERSQAMREKMLGLEHPDVATTLNNRAVLLYKQEKYTEAVPLLERALSICTKELGENHPDTVSSQNSLKIVRQKVREQLGRLVGKRHTQPLNSAKAWRH